MIKENLISFLPESKKRNNQAMMVESDDVWSSNPPTKRARRSLISLNDHDSNPPSEEVEEEVEEEVFSEGEAQEVSPEEEEEDWCQEEEEYWCPEEEDWYQEEGEEEVGSEGEEEEVTLEKEEVWYQSAEEKEEEVRSKEEEVRPKKVVRSPYIVYSNPNLAFLQTPTRRQLRDLDYLHDIDSDPEKQKLIDVFRSKLLSTTTCTGPYSFVCEICVDLKPASGWFPIKNCRNAYCADCIVKHVASKLEQNITSIRCPVPDCPSEFLCPEDCRPILPDNLFDRWASVASAS